MEELGSTTELDGIPQRSTGDSSCLDILSFLFGGGGRNVMIVISFYINYSCTRVILVLTSQALQVHRLQNEKSCRILYCKAWERGYTYSYVFHTLLCTCLLKALQIISYKLIDCVICQVYIVTSLVTNSSWIITIYKKLLTTWVVGTLIGSGGKIHSFHGQFKYTRF